MMPTNRLREMRLVAAIFTFLCLTVAGVAGDLKDTQSLAAKLGSIQAKLSPLASNVFLIQLSCAGEPKPVTSSYVLPSKDMSPPNWTAFQQSGDRGIAAGGVRLWVDSRTESLRLESGNRQLLIISNLSGGGSVLSGAGKTNLAVVFKSPAGAPPVAGAYGSGNAGTELLQKASKSHVANGVAAIPFYWSPDGYAVLVTSEDDDQPASWKLSPKDGGIIWDIPGKSAGLYVFLAADIQEACRIYARLTGFAPVPPRWAFGYLQSRWGWKDRGYIEEVLNEFRTRKIPVDAFIYDFEWYTTKPDYELPVEGWPQFSDFSWNTNLFPDPARQIDGYKQAGVRTLVIRKPRLGNSATLVMARSNGWDVTHQAANHTEKFQSRDLDFANPDLRAWYAGQTTNLLAQGIDGWWNDEGEGTYTAYYHWNLAERDAQSQVNGQRRMWTLNRAFSPGMQRLGACAWTGDIRSTWKALAETPASLLNWSLAGMPYGACDIGGYDGEADPSPEMLARWMQAGVFFPIMRSHSALSRTPRFPWLFGPEAERAIRQAIELRYRLIPYYYSLAHETFNTGLPLMRPLFMEFPQDTHVANLSDQWLMGTALMAAPVLNPGGQRTVYFPGGNWYVFSTNSLIRGGTTLAIKAALDEVPVFVRAGTILPLGPVVQHTGQHPGGALELQIYPGKDAAFTLVEDDGETTAYREGRTRLTTFRWHDAEGRLEWNTEDACPEEKGFSTMRVSLFDRRFTQKELPLTPQGSVRLRR